jgi:hypothetical protein
MQLQNNDSDKCQYVKLNLQYLIMLFKGKGRDFSTEYNVAKVRMEIILKPYALFAKKNLIMKKVWKLLIFLKENC